MAFEIVWTSKSYEDIASIYEYLVKKTSVTTADKIIDEIFEAPSRITYPEQFQFDQYRKECRRIIVRNYKILYYHTNDTIAIMRVFNTYQNPIRSLK